MIRIAFLILFVTLILSVVVGHKVPKKAAWAFIFLASFGSLVLAFLFAGAGVNASDEQDSNVFISIIYTVSPALIALLPLGIAGLWHASRRENENA